MRTHAHTMDAFCHLARARWTEMYASGEQATAIAERLGLARRRDDLQTLLAWAELVRGDLAASEARHLRMRAARRRGETQSDLWIRVGLAAVHVERDRLDEAFEEIRVPEERYAQSALRTELLALRALRAVVHLRRGELGAARQAADDALAMIRAMSASSLVSLPSYERVAEVFAGALVPGPDAARARRALGRVAGGVRRAGARSEAPPHLAPRRPPRARLARVPRGSGRARVLGLEACLTAARAMEMPQHAALADLALGRHGPPAERRAHLDRALATFERLGAAHRREQALAASAAS